MSIDELIDNLESIKEELPDGGEAEVDVHYQSNWPLLGGVANVRELNGTAAIAISGGDEYGTKAAWEDSDSPYS